MIRKQEYRSNQLKKSLYKWVNNQIGLVKGGKNMAWALIKPWKNNQIFTQSERKKSLLKQLHTKEPMTNKRIASLKSGDHVTVLYPEWKNEDVVDGINGCKSTKRVLAGETEVTYMLVELTIQTEELKITKEDAKSYLQALRDIDTHIRSTPTPIPYIIEELKKILPEYQPQPAIKHDTEFERVQRIMDNMISINVGLPIWNEEVVFGDKCFQELVIQQFKLKGYEVIRHELEDGLHLQLIQLQPLPLKI